MNGQSTPQKQIIYLEIIDSCLMQLNELENRIGFISMQSPCEETKSPSIQKTMLEERLLILLGRINGIKDNIRN